MRSKIAFYVFFSGGGIGRYTFELLKVLGTEEAVEMHLLCSPSFQWKTIKGCQTIPKLVSISHSFPVFRKMIFLIGQWINPWRAAKLAEQEGIEIVHFSQINYLSFPFWKNHFKKRGIKIAISAHDIRRQKPILYRQWEEKQLKKLYNFADALFVHSEFQAEELIEFSGVKRDKIHVVPHGPYPYVTPKLSKEALRLKYKLPINRSIALFFGLIRDEKNLAGFLNALAKVPNRPHLVIAGSQTSRHMPISHYEDLIAQLDLTNSVSIFPGYLPDEQVGEFFTLCDWVALPYDASFTSQSGVLNIAAYFKKPVLAGAAPVIAETVKKGKIGITCEKNTPTELVAAIEIMEQKDKDKLTFDFESYQKQYGWEENARISIQVYQDLILP